MKMSNSVYDALKFIAQILLPAIGTLYFALARIWELPLGSARCSTTSWKSNRLMMKISNTDWKTTTPWE